MKSLGHNITFQAYLDEHRLQLGEIARYAGVPYITVWNILRNKPVTQLHAYAVRASLEKMTGVTYIGPILTLIR